MICSHQRLSQMGVGEKALPTPTHTLCSGNGKVSSSETLEFVARRQQPLLYGGAPLSRESSPARRSSLTRQRLWERRLARKSKTQE